MEQLSPNVDPVTLPKRPRAIRPAAPAFDLQEEEIKDDEVSIENIIADEALGTGATVKLELQRPGTTEYNFIDKVPVEQVSLVWLRDTYGGGNYKLTFMTADNKYYRRMTAKIDPSFVGRKDAEKNKANGHSETAAVITALAPQSAGALLERQEKSLQTFLTLMMSQQQAQSQQFTSLLAAMMKRPEGESTSDKLLVAILPALMQKTPMADLIAAIKLGKGMDPDEEPPQEPSLFEKILDKAAPALISLAGAAASRQLPPMAPPPSAPAAGPAVEQLPAPAQPNDEETMIINLVANRLLKGARDNADPVLYAEMIEELVPGAVLANAKAMLAQPNWFELLKMQIPEAANHQPWFTRLRDELLAEPAPVAAKAN